MFGEVWSSWPLQKERSVTSNRFVTSVTGGPVPVVSRAAQEWLRPPACAEHFQQAVFLSGRGMGGLVSVCANFTQKIYHQYQMLSRGK